MPSQLKISPHQSPQNLKRKRLRPSNQKHLLHLQRQLRILPHQPPKNLKRKRRRPSSKNHLHHLQRQPLKNVPHSRSKSMDSAFAIRTNATNGKARTYVHRKTPRGNVSVMIQFVVNTIWYVMRGAYKESASNAKKKQNISTALIIRLVTRTTVSV